MGGKLEFLLVTGLCINFFCEVVAVPAPSDIINRSYYRIRRQVPSNDQIGAANQPKTSPVSVNGQTGNVQPITSTVRWSSFPLTKKQQTTSTKLFQTPLHVTPTQNVLQGKTVSVTGNVGANEPAVPTKQGGDLTESPIPSIQKGKIAATVLTPAGTATQFVDTNKQPPQPNPVPATTITTTTNNQGQNTNPMQLPAVSNTTPESVKATNNGNIPEVVGTNQPSAKLNPAKTTSNPSMPAVSAAGGTHMSTTPGEDQPSAMSTISTASVQDTSTVEDTNIPITTLSLTESPSERQSSTALQSTSSADTLSTVTNGSDTTPSATTNPQTSSTGSVDISTALLSQKPNTTASDQASTTTESSDKSTAPPSVSTKEIILSTTESETTVWSTAMSTSKEVTSAEHTTEGKTASHSPTIAVAEVSSAAVSHNRKRPPADAGREDGGNDMTITTTTTQGSVATDENVENAVKTERPDDSHPTSNGTQQSEDDWISQTKKYVNEVVEQYGALKVSIAMLVVIMALFLVMFCCCRMCRKKGYKMHQRRLKEFGQEKEFLLRDRGSKKNQYSNDTVTLLDGSSEDEF